MNIKRHIKLSEQQKESREWTKLAKLLLDRKDGKMAICSRCGMENFKKYFTGDLCHKCAAQDREDAAMWEMELVRRRNL
jgi:hypothetical protein